MNLNRRQNHSFLILHLSPGTERTHWQFCWAACCWGVALLSHDLCPLSLLPVCTCSWENAIHQLCYILGFPYLSQIAVDTSLTEQICNDSVSMFWQILTPSAKLGFCMHSVAFNRSSRLLWLILPWYCPVGKTINLPCQVTKSKMCVRVSATGQWQL